MTVFASFVNKLKKQLKFPALQGVGSNRAIETSQADLSFSVSSCTTDLVSNVKAGIRKWDWIKKPTWQGILSLSARALRVSLQKPGGTKVSWSNRENGQRFKNRGCVVLKHCLVSGVSTWFVQNWQSGIFYSPPARAHVVEKSGCPCPGWSRSKLVG